MMKSSKPVSEKIVVPHKTGDGFWCKTKYSNKRFSGGPRQTNIIKINVVILYFFI